MEEKRREHLYPKCCTECRLLIDRVTVYYIVFVLCTGCRIKSGKYMLYIDICSGVVSETISLVIEAKCDAYMLDIL